MRFKEKLLILFFAVILSLVGFYLISTSFAELHTLAKKAEQQELDGHLVEWTGDASRTRTSIDSSPQLSCLDIYCGYSRYLYSLKASK